MNEKNPVCYPIFVGFSQGLTDFSRKARHGEEKQRPVTLRNRTLIDQLVY